MTIPTPSNCFDTPGFAGKWFHWDEINACFWPGVGGRSERVNPELAPIRNRGGIYLLAWSRQRPDHLRPDLPEVKYIGETGEFKSRLGNFGNSAGIWGERSDGHSAGWRWPKADARDLWVAFFEIGTGLPDHLACGLRKWMEAVALEEHRAENGSLPLVNGTRQEVSFEP
jgi:hypothetical protein